MPPRSLDGLAGPNTTSATPLLISRWVSSLALGGVEERKVRQAVDRRLGVELPASHLLEQVRRLALHEAEDTGGTRSGEHDSLSAGGVARVPDRAGWARGVRGTGRRARTRGAPGTRPRRRRSRFRCEAPYRRRLGADERGEDGRRVVHREHGHRRQHAGAERVRHRRDHARHQDVADLAQRRSAARRPTPPRRPAPAAGGRVTPRRRAPRAVRRGRPRSRRRRRRAGPLAARAVARRRPSGVGAQEPHRRHAHPTRAADEARECGGRVARADARARAPGRWRTPDDAQVLHHARWFRSSTKTGAPFPRTVIPASARADASSRGRASRRSPVVRPGGRPPRSTRGRVPRRG